MHYYDYLNFILLFLAIRVDQLYSQYIQEHETLSIELAQIEAQLTLYADAGIS